MVLPTRRRGPSGPLDTDGVGARLSMAGTFSVAAATATIVGWDTEDYDTGSFITQAAAPFLSFTLPRTGFYLTGVFLNLSASVDDELACFVIRGAAVPGVTLLAQNLSPVGGGNVMSVSTAGVIAGTAGDVISAVALQNDAAPAARNVVAFSSFWIIEVES